jgi:hypothetical protein
MPIGFAGSFSELQIAIDTSLDRPAPTPLETTWSSQQHAADRDDSRGRKHRARHSLAPITMDPRGHEPRAMTMTHVGTNTSFWHLTLPLGPGPSRGGGAAGAAALVASRASGGRRRDKRSRHRSRLDPRGSARPENVISPTHWRLDRLVPERVRSESADAAAPRRRGRRFQSVFRRRVLAEARDSAHVGQRHFTSTTRTASTSKIAMPIVRPPIGAGISRTGGTDGGMKPQRGQCPDSVPVTYDLQLKQ